MQIPLVVGASAVLYVYMEARERAMQWEDGITQIILLTARACLINSAIKTASITLTVSTTYTFQNITQDQIMHSF